MQITGFRAFEALQYAYQLMNPIRWRITLAQIVVFVAVEALVCACAFFVAVPIVFTVAVAVLYAGVLMIYCVRMQIAYFDRDNMERADIKFSYNGWEKE